MNRKLLAAVIGAAVTLAGALIGYTASGKDSDDAVAQVNGTPVTLAEFEQALNRQRATVIGYFHRTYGADYGEQFWQRDYNGETPLSMVKERALQELTRTKVELDLAKQYGLLPGTSHEDLQKEMDKENEQRSAAIKARLPVYGPTQMDEDTFIPYYISKLRIALKEKLTADELGLTGEELLRIKEAEHNPVLPAEERVRFQKIAAAYRNTTAERSSAGLRKAAEEKISSLRVLLDRGADISQALEQLPFSDTGSASIQLRVTEEVLNQETASIIFKSQPSLYSVLTGSAELKPGQVSPVFDEALQGEWVVIQVLEREETSNQTGDNRTDQAERQTLDIIYSRYLDRLVAEATVTINRSRYDSVSPK